MPTDLAETSGVSSLYFIRHGQASLFDPDYDRLSSRGIAQSAALGRYFARFGVCFDALYAGTHRRHGETATAMLEAAEISGVVPRVDVAFDEFPAFELAARLLDQRRAVDPKCPNVDGPDPSDRPARTRWLRDLLVDTVRAWVAGELSGTDLETYQAFKARVRRGLEVVGTAASAERHVAVVSSAGTIAMVVQAVLGASDDVGSGFIFTLANSAITEIRFRDARWWLASFNALPHLDDPTQITLG